MAELPGWDRARLATAAPADVTAARWLVYARVMAPGIAFDFPGAIHSLELAGMKPQQRERADASDRRAQLHELHAGKRKQLQNRALLRLDEPDEAD
jgi:hypothetical protein